MENKLDKLFRDKLEHHTMQPPANAWEKVAAGFPKKNNTIVWAWRMAAVLALMGVISLLVIRPWQDEEASTLAKETVQEEKKSDTPVVEKKEVPLQEVTPKTVEPKKTQPIVTPKLYNRPVEQPVAEVKKEIVEPTHEAIAMTTESTKIEEPILPVTETFEQNTEKTLVIVYTLAPVESKPAPETVKTKPLQRMLTFAKEVKSGETTLASVRNWKDNFFGTEETARVEKQTSNN